MSLSGISASPSAPAYAAVQARPGARGSSAMAGQTGKGGALTPEQQAQVAKLKAEDRKVRAHEQAHLAAAGGIATSGANYTYQRGPDGVNYAVAGEVSIDTSPGKTPEETLSKANTIRSAALAPADPSGQDRAVAAAASQMAAQARQELNQTNSADNGASSSASPASTESASPVSRYYGQSGDIHPPRIDTYA